MPLTPEQIQKLMNLPKVGRRSGPNKNKITGIGNKKVDITVRNYETWFNVNHVLIDMDTQELVLCDNPNCVDPRDKTHGQTVTVINEKRMCRFCFLDGWLITPIEQLELDDAS